MKEKSFLREIIEYLLNCLAITFIIVNFLIFPCTVDGPSMYPTLKDGQRGFSLVCTKFFGVNRFDIVVIKIDDGVASKKIVKRVIGMPGDRVEYVNNCLYINGQYYEEEFLGDVNTEDLAITLGDDEYYCLGDNRDVSKDSRYYGPFHKESFVSNHYFVLYPFEDFGYRS